MGLGVGDAAGFGVVTGVVVFAGWAALPVGPGEVVGVVVEVAAGLFAGTGPVATVDAGVVEAGELVLPVAGVLAGAVGSVVIGLGSGGSGFDKTLAITSDRPASD